MAGSIRVLPKLLVDQIAAGEVVERPASVVRELLDNALDAGAKSVDVEIGGGGRALVRVSDDGSGIPLEELPLAFATHATSKLSSLEDLTCIASLGFRGEALASIGAVSRSKIRSRAAGSAHAGELECEGGRLTAVRPAARVQGTDVEVRDLFFNTPARRRFLKRDATETAHALDAVIRQGLAHPETAFRAVADGKVAVDFPLTRAVESDADVDNVRRERIRIAFGELAERDLTSFRVAERGVSLAGFAGSPETAEAGAGRIHFFVNGRFVQDRGASRVARDATKDFFGSRLPILFLFLTLDPSLVDVNVHPAKMEVRFREPGLVYGLIHRALRAVYERTRPAASAESLLAGAPVFAAEPVKSFGRESFLRETPALFAAESAPPVVSRAAKYLRAFETFLVVESAEGIDLLDQHALHERVNFEEMRARVLSGDPPRQGLLVPEVVPVSREDAVLAEEFAEPWSAVGLEVTRAGPLTVAVRAVPAGTKRSSIAPLLADLLDLARSGGRPSSDRAREELLHRCACHASVKAGDPLTDSEIESLLARAARLPADQTCPHGRPSRIRLTRRDLERAFERT